MSFHNLPPGDGYDSHFQFRPSPLGEVAEGRVRVLANHESALQLLDRHR